MKCEKSKELFSDYMDGVLNTSAVNELEKHLLECNGCKSEYEKLNACMLMIEELPELDVPNGIQESIMAEIRRANEEVVKRRRWFVDISNIFTVKLPARAIAFGAVALFALGIAVRYTPVAQIPASWLPARTGEVAITNSTFGPKAWSNDQQYVENSGLSVVADAEVKNGVSEYSIRFVAKSKTDINLNISSDWQNISTSVSLRNPYIMDLGPQNSSRTVIANWHYNDNNYSKVVYLPSKFDASARKSLGVNFKNESISSLLSKISENYGIVIIASGDLSKNIGNVNIKNATPDEVFYEVTVNTTLRWSVLAPSVYSVEAEK